MYGCTCWSRSSNNDVTHPSANSSSSLLPLQPGDTKVYSDSGSVEAKAAQQQHGYSSAAPEPLLYRYSAGGQPQLPQQQPATCALVHHMDDCNEQVVYPRDVAASSHGSGAQPHLMFPRQQQLAAEMPSLSRNNSGSQQMMFSRSQQEQQQTPSLPSLLRNNPGSQEMFARSQQQQQQKPGEPPKVSASNSGCQQMIYWHSQQKQQLASKISAVSPHSSSGQLSHNLSRVQHQHQPTPSHPSAQQLHVLSYQQLPGNLTGPNLTPSGSGAQQMMFAHSQATQKQAALAMLQYKTLHPLLMNQYDEGRSRPLPQLLAAQQQQQQQQQHLDWQALSSPLPQPPPQQQRQSLDGHTLGTGHQGQKFIDNQALGMQQVMAMQQQQQVEDIRVLARVLPSQEVTDMRALQLQLQQQQQQQLMQQVVWLQQQQQGDLGCNLSTSALTQAMAAAQQAPTSGGAMAGQAPGMPGRQMQPQGMLPPPPPPPPPRGQQQQQQQQQVPSATWPQRQNEHTVQQQYNLLSGGRLVAVAGAGTGAAQSPFQAPGLFSSGSGGAAAALQVYGQRSGLAGHFVPPPLPRPPLGPQLPDGVYSRPVAVPKPVPLFECGICNIECNSTVNLKQHVASRKHQVKAAKLADAGLEAAARERYLAEGQGAQRPQTKVHSLCRQLLSPDLDAVVSELLTSCKTCQDEGDASEQVTRGRRYVCGLHEVREAVKLRLAICVVVAPDVEQVDTGGKPDNRLQDIMDRCAEAGLSVVFAVSRKRLGQIFGGATGVSAVALLDLHVFERLYTRLVQLVAEARNGWEEETRLGSGPPIQTIIEQVGSEEEAAAAAAAAIPTIPASSIEEDALVMAAAAVTEDSADPDDGASAFAAAAKIPDVLANSTSLNEADSA